MRTNHSKSGWQQHSCGVCRRLPRSRTEAFTLLEALITAALLLLLVASSIAALMFMNRSSSRLAGHVAVMATVQGEIERIRAEDYNPPTGTNFIQTTVRFTNTPSIFLSKAGTNLLVKGKLVTEIKPVGVSVGAGHLVTVTGTFPTPGQPTVVILQTVVNRFSGGQR